MTSLIIITQGTTRTIKASNIVDGNGQPLIITGWAVLAVIRELVSHATRDRQWAAAASWASYPSSAYPSYEPSAVTGPMVAEWSTTPTGTQGTATAIDREVTLAITPVMSTAWAWRHGVLHAEITEPVSPFRVERIIDRVVYLDPEGVR